MNKRNLLSSTRMTPIERKMGRLMRAPDHPGESNDGGNNPAGNDGGSAESESGGDNTGQSFDPAAFWAGPAEEKTAAPSEGGSSDSAGADNSSAGQPGDSMGQQLSQRIADFKIEPVFTPEIAEQLNEGNMEGANAAIQTAAQNAMKESIVASAHMLQEYAGVLMSQVQSKIDEAFGNRDSEATLENEFTSYKDPAMRKQIDSIFEQSMKNTNGNREEAVKQTREMLRLMGDRGADDMGIQTPPGGRGDETANSKNLVDELLGMSISQK